MLTLILADAELERVPARLTGHQQVVSSAQRAGVSPARMLLDSSLHYAALRDIPDGERRGRPDLVHFFLLTALESIANKQGRVRVHVHTRNDEVISLAPQTRLIRNYNRFCGLIQQLLDAGTLNTSEPLLTLRRKTTLANLVAELAPQRVLLLDPAGPLQDPRDLFPPSREQSHVVAIIGGFPSGDYRSPPPEGAQRVSIHPDPLTVWTVAAELLAAYRATIRTR